MALCTITGKIRDFFKIPRSSRFFKKSEILPVSFENFDTNKGIGNVAVSDHDALKFIEVSNDMFPTELKPKVSLLIKELKK